MTYPDHVEDFRLHERYRRESEAYSRAMAKRADRRMLLVILLAAFLGLAFLALCVSPNLHAQPPVGLTVRDLFAQMGKLPDDGVKYNSGTTLDGKAVDLVYDKRAGTILLTVLR